MPHRIDHLYVHLEHVRHVRRIFPLLQKRTELFPPETCSMITVHQIGVDK